MRSPRMDIHAVIAVWKSFNSVLVPVLSVATFFLVRRKREKEAALYELLFKVSVVPYRLMALRLDFMQAVLKHKLGAPPD